jgi:U4/U6 small nuclear ribonucleoprotein PRP3
VILFIYLSGSLTKDVYLVQRDAPPNSEWWDAALLPNKTYEDLSLPFSSLNIRNTDSPITIYIQHPIPIPAPGEKNKVALKPLMLTKKEQKKMRKQKRQADLQDKRDRIRMGLIPPDPPKGMTYLLFGVVSY